MKKLILVLSAILFMTDANAASVVSRSGRAGAAATRSAPVTTSARSAVRNTAARSATKSVEPTVKARSATTQKVIGTGTKIAVVNENVIATEC